MNCYSCFHFYPRGVLCRLGKPRKEDCPNYQPIEEIKKRNIVIDIKKDWMKR